VVGLGTAGIGTIAFGAVAIADKAYAWISAHGLESAFSQGLAVAKDGAIGPVAVSNRVNTEQAAEIVNLAALGQSYLWVAKLTLISEDRNHVIKRRCVSRRFERPLRHACTYNRFL
jgi:hypothetical protein